MRIVLCFFAFNIKIRNTFSNAKKNKTPGGIIGGAVDHPASSAVPVVVFAAKCTLCQSSYSSWITGCGAKITMLLLCSVFTRIQAHGQHVRSLVKLKIPYDADGLDLWSKFSSLVAGGFVWRQGATRAAQISVGAAKTRANCQPRELKDFSL